MKAYIEMKVAKAGPESVPLESERKLEQRFGISRPTIHQAMEELVEDGWCLKLPGKRFLYSNPARSNPIVRGKAGDCENFIKAISIAVLDDPDKLPCRIGFELKSADALNLSLINPLARELTGKLNIFGRKYDLSIPKLGELTLEIKLAAPIRKGRLEKLTITTEPGSGCYNKPHVWPVAVLTE